MAISRATKGERYVFVPVKAPSNSIKSVMSADLILSCNVKQVAMQSICDIHVGLKNVFKRFLNSNVKLTTRGWGGGQENI